MCDLCHERPLILSDRFPSHGSFLIKLPTMNDYLTQIHTNYSHDHCFHLLAATGSGAERHNEIIIVTVKRSAENNVSAVCTMDVANMDCSKSKT